MARADGSIENYELSRKKHKPKGGRFMSHPDRVNRSLLLGSEHRNPMLANI